MHSSLRDREAYATETIRLALPALQRHQGGFNGCGLVNICAYFVQETEGVQELASALVAWLTEAEADQHKLKQYFDEQRLLGEPSPLYDTNPGTRLLDQTIRAEIPEAIMPVEYVQQTVEIICRQARNLCPVSTELPKLLVILLTRLVALHYDPTPANARFLYQLCRHAPVMSCGELRRNCPGAGICNNDEHVILDNGKLVSLALFDPAPKQSFVTTHGRIIRT